MPLSSTEPAGTTLPTDLVTWELVHDSGAWADRPQPASPPSCACIILVTSLESCLQTATARGWGWALACESGGHHSS